MTPERLAEIEQQHERNTGIGRDECLRRGCLTCLFATALRAAWAERDEARTVLLTTYRALLRALLVPGEEFADAVSDAMDGLWLALTDAQRAGLDTEGRDG